MLDLHVGDRLYRSPLVEVVIEQPTIPVPAILRRIKRWTNAEVDAGFVGYAHSSKPEIRRRLPSKKLNSGENRTNVSGWDGFFLALNEYDPVRNNYIRADDKFCFNDKGWPQMASVDTAGNIVGVERFEGSWAKLITLNLSDGVPDINLVNKDATPWLVHKLWLVHKDYRRLDIIKGGQIHYPVVLDSGKEAWMPTNWLEPV